MQGAIRSGHIGHVQTWGQMKNMCTRKSPPTVARWDGRQKAEPCLFYLIVCNTVKQYKKFGPTFSVTAFHPCLSSLSVTVGSEAHENEGYFEEFHSFRFYISKRLLIVSTEWTRLIHKKIFNHILSSFSNKQYSLLLIKPTRCTNFSNLFLE